MTDFLFLQRFESGVARSLPLDKVRELLGAAAAQRDADGVVEFEFAADTLADLAIAVKDAEGGVSCVAFLCPKFDPGLRALVWQCMEALGCVAFDDTLTRILIPAAAGDAAGQALPAQMAGAGATVARQVSNPCQLWPDWLDTRPDAADRYVLVGRSADGNPLVQCFDQVDEAGQRMQIDLGMVAQACNTATLGGVYHLRLRVDDAVANNPKYGIALRFLDSETALRVMEFAAAGRKTVKGVQIISPFPLEVRRWPVFVSDRGNFLSLEEQAHKAIELAREQFGLQLDGTPASVRTLANLLDQVHQAFQNAASASAQKKSEADLQMQQWSVRAGCYLGLLVCRQVGGQVGHIRVNGWRLICVRMHTGRVHFPLLRVLDHIVNGSADGIVPWFEQVALDDASATQRPLDWVCNIPGFCFTLLGQSRLSTGGLPLEGELPREQLDFSLDSLRHLDSYLARVREQAGKLPEQTEMNLVVLAGAYLGEVVRSSAPTRWLWEPYDDYARAHPDFAERRPRQAIVMALLDSPDESAYPMANVAAILRGVPVQSCHEFAVNLVGEPDPQAGAATPSKDPAQAALDLRAAADAGNADAQFELGLACQLGLGVEQSAESAQHWYQLAFNQGHLAAHYNLGHLWFWYDARHFKGDDPANYIAEDQWLPALNHATRADTGITWYATRAEEGDAVAQWLMGLCTEHGTGGAQKDLVEALRWYRMGTQLGFGPAICNLADKYEKGIGVAPDLKEAMRLYLLAVDHSVAAASYSIGRMYRDGRGVPRDDVQAVVWFKRAVEAGSSDARIALAQNPAGDLQRARAMLEVCDRAQGADPSTMPDAAAIWTLAMDVDDHDVPETRTLAFALYLHAAKLGHYEAQLQVAFRYQRGIAVAQDSVVAAGWYLKSAEQGYSDAQMALAKLYETGSGVPQDVEMADHWYRKAAAQGNREAEHKLGLRASKEPDAWELGITMREIGSASVLVNGEDAGNELASFRESTGNVLSVTVPLGLIAALMLAMGGTPRVLGFILAVWVAYRWLDWHKYRITIYDHALVQTTLFRMAGLRMHAGTRYFYASAVLPKAGVPPRTPMRVTLEEGGKRLELRSRVNDALGLRQQLLAAEKRDHLSRAIQSLRTGKSVDFELLQLQNGRIQFRKNKAITLDKDLAFADLAAVRISGNRFNLYKRDARMASFSAKLDKVPNVDTLVRLLEAHTPATVSIE